MQEGEEEGRRKGRKDRGKTHSGRRESERELRLFAFELLKASFFHFLLRQEGRKEKKTEREKERGISSCLLLSTKKKSVRRKKNNISSFLSTSFLHLFRRQGIPPLSPFLLVLLFLGWGAVNPTRVMKEASSLRPLLPPLSVGHSGDAEGSSSFFSFSFFHLFLIPRKKRGRRSVINFSLLLFPLSLSRVTTLDCRGY